VSDSANLDLVRSLYAAWERGEWTSADWIDPEIEMIVVGGPEPGRWIGLESVRAQTISFLSVWHDYRVEAEQVRELDDERMLVLTRYSGRAKTSGLEVRTEGAHVLHVRDGKVTRYVRYWDRDRALADLGLAPEGDAA
jgi:ketosteroid isomerase-like protein